MSEQQYGRRAVEVGPTGKTVADNLTRLRKARGYSTRQLAAELDRNGRPISASGITRMEKGDRVVTADDLAALAVLFGVSPASLLLPHDDSPARRVEVTGAGLVPADDAWSWASNERPLKMPEGQAKRAMLEYKLYGLPPGRAGLEEEAMPLTYIKGGVRYDAATGKPIEGEGADGPSVD